MAGPRWTYCVSEYCIGVPHNEHPRRLHYLRPISVPVTKNAEEPNFRVHLNPGGIASAGTTPTNSRLSFR